MNFHTRLKTIRLQRRISIRRLCSDLKINKTTYENWELGVCPSRPELYRMLAEYLDVPVEFLMFGDRKNTEWDQAILHLRRYVEDLVEEKLREVVMEQAQNGGNILGQGRGVLSQ